jgi:Spy/CpxP family protein refolding chaperone
MKKFFFSAFILFVFFSINVNAQMRMSHQDRVKQYQERLKLTDEQTAKVDSIITLSENAMKYISTDDREQRRAEMMKIRDDVNTQIEKILTDEQKTEFNKMKEERMNRPGRNGNRPNN